MKFSIITPAFNAEKTISQTIQSVISQTYQDWELIVVDDGSTDSTKQVVESFMSDSRITYVYQKNSGTGKARNVGVVASSGDLIAFLDADDFWHEEKLEKQITCFHNTDIVGLYTEVYTFEDSPTQYKKIKRNFFTKPRSGNIYPYFAFHNIITLSSAVVRRSVFETVGGFEELRDLMTVEDLDFWLRVARLGKIQAISERFTYYRTRSFSEVSPEIFYKKLIYVYKRYKTFWSQVGLFRVKLGLWFSRMKLLQKLKKNGLRKITKEVVRRFWLKMDFIVYPIVIGRIKKFITKNNSIEDIINFPSRSTMNVLVLGQVESEIYNFLKYSQEKNIKNVLEIGTAQGGNLFVLSQIAESGGTIASLDLPGGHWGGGYVSRKSKVYQSFGKKGQTIHLVRGDSHTLDSLDKIKSIFKDTPIDLLFIDGDHTYEGVRQDFEMYSPLVKKGGIVAFHDIALPADPDFGVRDFWLEIRNNFESYEYIENANQRGYGIGVVIV